MADAEVGPLVTVSRRAFLAGGAAAAVLAACGKARRRAAVSPPTSSPAAVSAPSSTPTTSGSPASFVRHGPVTSNEVALSFHGSGDVGLVNQLLDEAKKANTPITIFVVGQWLDANPQMAARILGEGHELANHTYTHPALATVSPSALNDEITRCRDLLVRLTKTDGRWFRPSGVDVPTAAMLAAAGRAGYGTVVGYDVDPLDYQDPGAATIVSRVRSGIKAGSIVSLHTGHAGTVEAFRPMVDAIRSRGWAPVTVGTLLA